MLTVERIKTVVAELGRKYGIKSAYLFGSYARGEANENSDVDIIIEKGRVQSFNVFADFRYDLVNELGTEVDLITTVGVRPKFFDFIKDDRILLYDAA